MKATVLQKSATIILMRPLQGIWHQSDQHPFHQQCDVAVDEERMKAWPIVGIKALTLLVGRQERHLAYKKLCHLPRRFSSQINGGRNPRLIQDHVEKADNDN